SRRYAFRCNMAHCKPKMSNESRERSRKTNTLKTARDLEREFDAALMHRARKTASDYTIVVQPHDLLGFMGSSVEIPTVFTHGKTEAECLRTTREALGIA